MKKAALLLSALFLVGLTLTFPSHILAQGTCTGTCYTAPSCSGLGIATATGSCPNTNQVCCTGTPSEDRGYQGDVPEINERNNGLKAEGPNLNKLVVSNFRGIFTEIGCISGGTPLLGCEPPPGGTGVTAGLYGVLTEQIIAMYENPAANTQTYVADLMNTAGFGIAQPAYAQGLGFASLSPILNAWKQFRNLAYVFFVIIFVVLGFMIMLRQKVGQTAVTAQQALPKVIVALLAVTFSYAIAGFLIDLMYLLMFLLVGMFNMKEDLLDKNFLQLALYLIGGSIDQVDVVGDLVQATFASFTNKAASGIAGIAEIGFAVIIVLAIVFSMFRLFFELLKTYVSIIISITLSPLLLMMEAIPGRNVFKGWVKSLVGNLMVFPVVLVILIIYGTLAGTEGNDEAIGGFMPPYLIGVGSGNAISVLIGLGMILIMPELVIQAKKAMGASGGVFEQFGGNIANALKRGWKGDELIPGLGFTKIPGAKSIDRTAAVGAASLAGLGAGAARGVYRMGRYGETRQQAGARAAEGARFLGRITADTTGSGFYNESRKDRTKNAVRDIFLRPRGKAAEYASKEGKPPTSK